MPRPNMPRLLNVHMLGLQVSRTPLKRLQYLQTPLTLHVGRRVSFLHHKTYYGVCSLLNTQLPVLSNHAAQSHWSGQSKHLWTVGSDLETTRVLATSPVNLSCRIHQDMVIRKNKDMSGTTGEAVQMAVSDNVESGEGGSGNHGGARSNMWGFLKMSLKAGALIISSSLAYITTVLVWNNELYPLTARQVVGVSPALAGMDLTLYQFGSCPFCCKVRSFLDFYGFTYQIKEVDPLWKWRSHKGKKVPMIKLADGTEVQDSSLIVSVLQTFLVHRGQLPVADILNFYPMMEDQQRKRLVPANRHAVMYGNQDRESIRREESKWRQWVDDHLVHIISPNVYRSWGECVEAFMHFGDLGGWSRLYGSVGVGVKYAEIYIGAVAMYFLSKVLKKKYGLKEDVRESLYEAGKEWTDAVGPARAFMGGDTLNLADLSVYGSLCAFEDCQAFRDLMGQNRELAQWYLGVKKAVFSHDGARTLLWD